MTKMATGHPLLDPRAPYNALEKVPAECRAILFSWLDHDLLDYKAKQKGCEGGLRLARQAVEEMIASDMAAPVVAS